MFSSGLKVFLHVHVQGRLRHELHESHGAFPRHGIGVEIRFHLDDGMHERRIDAVPVAGVVDHVGIGRSDVLYRREDGRAAEPAARP